MQDLDESDLIPQALPVAKLPENFDFNTAPITGEDYLSRVRIEATKDSIVIARNIDLEKFEKNRTFQYFQSDVNQEERKEFKASREWQCEKSAEFSQLRDKVRKEKDNFLRNNPVDKKKLYLSSLKSKKDWYTFCYGKKAKKTESTTETEVVEHGHDPCLSLLYRMDQNSVVNLFDYHVEWIVSYGYSKKMAKKPLLPETHSSLRDLARECIKIRSQIMDPNDEKLTELNLFISLIGCYFEQRDLVDQD
ncbi:unnamed protein product [Brachionus calyciflorus]|uniref:Gem-associated protein 2 n=1 Tax=Brachionus calyciflorus TaxID=104777 RepID=A0A814GYK1_9BILA|nr:unnamed protein product [Brachionus calyciflorus]